MTEEFDKLLRAHPYYDKAGNPITELMVWGRLREDESYMRIGQDVIIMGEEPCNVSTVWMGIDHGFGRSEKPVIFESLVFGGPFDGEMMRYCTEEEAIKGHNEAVADLAIGMCPWWAHGGQDDDEFTHHVDADNKTGD